ncbi:unnamed protein product, partial [Symbiodinium pilosum]
SVKHLEATVKDMSVGVAQQQAGIEELKVESDTLARTTKRVDDLWRHVEGVKSDLVSLERSARESRAEILALTYGRSAGTYAPPTELPMSPSAKPPMSQPVERRARESMRLLADEPRTM